MPGKDAMPGRREAAAQRRQKALGLRLGGASYRQIAAALGVSLAVAHEDVTRELAQASKEHAPERDALRAVEAARLDALLVGVWPQAKIGNLAAVDRALRIAERRAKLLGLDAPMRQKIGGLDDEAVTITLDLGEGSLWNER